MRTVAYVPLECDDESIRETGREIEAGEIDVVVVGGTPDREALKRQGTICFYPVTKGSGGREYVLEMSVSLLEQCGATSDMIPNMDELRDDLGPRGLPESLLVSLSGWMRDFFEELPSFRASHRVPLSIPGLLTWFKTPKGTWALYRLIGQFLVLNKILPKRSSCHAIAYAIVLEVLPQYDLLYGTHAKELPRISKVGRLVSGAYCRTLVRVAISDEPE